MNKKTILAGLTILTLVNAPLLFAQGMTNLRVDITCPATQGQSNVVTNFGTYIAGEGIEQVDSNNPTQIYFLGPVPLGTPSKLTEYNNAGTNYDSTTGQVDCIYSQSGYPTFVVSYILTNGKGGSIQYSNSNFISISLPVGLAK